jgi:hypothetical protein
MNCIGWNGRGCGNAATVQELGVLQQTHQAKIMFLCETRQSSVRMKRLRTRLGLKGFYGVDSNGLSGGLALFWHESIDLEVKDANENFIDVWMRIAPDEPLFHATFVYGEPRTENRHHMWTKLTALRASSLLPWALIGDFNEAMWSYEHFSARPRPESQMTDFRDCLQLCGLKDLCFTGLPFTYDNRRAGNNNVLG